MKAENERYIIRFSVGHPCLIITSADTTRTTQLVLHEWVMFFIFPAPRKASWWGHNGLLRTQSPSRDARNLTFHWSRQSATWKCYDLLKGKNNHSTSLQAVSTRRGFQSTIKEGKKEKATATDKKHQLFILLACMSGCNCILKLATSNSKCWVLFGHRIISREVFTSRKLNSLYGALSKCSNNTSGGFCNSLTFVQEMQLIFHVETLK